MGNISFEVQKDGTIVIKIQPGNGVPSRTGKSLLVASTNGFVIIPGTDFKVNINMIKSIR